MTFFPFILRRARRHWQLWATLCLGVLLATALLATGPLLVDTVIEFGLRRTLLSSEPLQSHMRVKTRAAADQATYREFDSRMQTMLYERFDAQLDRIVRSVGANWMFPWIDGQLLDDQRINLHFYTDVEKHVEFVAGSWPDAPLNPDALLVVISDEMAQGYSLRVGDRLPLSFMNKATAPDTWIEVAGIVRPQDPLAPYWFGEFSPLASQRTQRWEEQYSVLVSEKDFFNVVPALFPESKIDIAWQALILPEKIKTQNITPIRRQIGGLIVSLHRFGSRAVLETELDEVLKSYQTQAQTIRGPLYILTAEVVLLALYYVTMVAALSVQQTEREFAILRSRGASSRQIIKIQLTEACLVAAVALLSGPVLGLAFVRGITWAGPLADVGQSNWGLNFTQNAWLAAIVGALACLGGLLLPIRSALRSSIVTHQHTAARPSRPPWWQRSYLDVFVLLIALILLWRLRLHGNLVVGGSGRFKLDWLLLLAPLALLLGSATILLRVFPIILRSLAAIAARARGLPGVLAMWQASRDPTHVTRLVLLLTLAIALGILSTGLGATLDQNEFERSRYLAGNDIRLISRRYVSPPVLQAAPGVLDLADTWRGKGTIDLQSATINYPTFQVLAIDPLSFANLTVYRDDYADDYMGALLGYLSIDGVQEKLVQREVHAPVPGQPARLGMWARVTAASAEIASTQRAEGDNELDHVSMRVKLQTAQGELFTVKLRRPVPGSSGFKPLVNRLALSLSNNGRETTLNFRMMPLGGWRYFETSLPALPPSSYPLTLHSLWFTNRPGPGSLTDISLAIDDIVVIDAETKETLTVEGFETPERTWFLNGGLSTAHLVRTDPRSGQGNLAVELRFGRTLQSVSMSLTKKERAAPLPAIVSPAFLESAELEIGDVVKSWINTAETELEIIGTVNYFPTMYADLSAGYLITSRDMLLPLLNRASHHSINPNEVFIESDEQTTVDTLAPLVPNLAQSWEAEAVRKTYKANPLALGLRSVTFFGYALTVLLSLVGFATHFYMNARQRATTYGVMRALGMSPRQLYGSLMLEQVILILTGLALGTGLGVLLNLITLPRLPIALGDSPPVPPFYPHSDWLAVGRIYIFLALAFLVTLSIATVLLWRARIHRVLRIGQE